MRSKAPCRRRENERRLDNEEQVVIREQFRGAAIIDVSKCYERKAMTDLTNSMTRHHAPLISPRNPIQNLSSSPSELHLDSLLLRIVEKVCPVGDISQLIRTSSDDELRLEDRVSDEFVRFRRSDLFREYESGVVGDEDGIVICIGRERDSNHRTDSRDGDVERRGKFASELEPEEEAPFLGNSERARTKNEDVGSVGSIVDVSSLARFSFFRIRCAEIVEHRFVEGGGGTIGETEDEVGRAVDRELGPGVERDDMAELLRSGEERNDGKRELRIDL